MDSETDQNQDVSETSEAPKRGFEPNTFAGTLIVALVLCVVCSLVVSTAAVVLRPIQQQNQKNKQQRNVLIAAGIWDNEKHTDADIPELFKSIETVAVQLPGRGDDVPEAGVEADSVDIATYDSLKASKDPDRSILIGDKDIAGIKRRELVALAYKVKDESGKLQSFVLPIYGKGLWSTLYGYIAIAADGQTVKGITFYQHGETPGLGGEVDNPKWKAQWPGKVVVDQSGEPILEVTKPGNASEEYQVDGLSGATITSSGVEKTVRYWLGEDAFGPFLERNSTSEVAVSGQ